VLTIKKGDMVKVISGRDLGKTGRVLSVERSTKRILVESVSMAKHHMKANPQKNIKGGILERESLVSASNVMLLCPSCGPTRPKAQTLPDGKKYRSCRKCGNTLV